MAANVANTPIWNAVTHASIVIGIVTNTLVLATFAYSFIFRHRMIRAIWRVAKGRADEYEQIRAAQFLQENPKITDVLPRALEQCQQPQKASRVAEFAVQTGSGARVRRHWGRRYNTKEHRRSWHRRKYETKRRIDEEPPLDEVEIDKTGVDAVKVVEKDTGAVRGRCDSHDSGIVADQSDDKDPPPPVPKEAITRYNIRSSSEQSTPAVSPDEKRPQRPQIQHTRSGRSQGDHNLSSTSLYSYFSEVSTDSSFQFGPAAEEGLDSGRSTDRILQITSPGQKSEDVSVLKLFPAIPKKLKRGVTVRDHIASCIA